MLLLAAVDACKLFGGGGHGYLASSDHSHASRDDGRLTSAKRSALDGRAGAAVGKSSRSMSFADISSYLRSCHITFGGVDAR